MQSIESGHNKDLIRPELAEPSGMSLENTIHLIVAFVIILVAAIGLYFMPRYEGPQPVGPECANYLGEEGCQ